MTFEALNKGGTTQGLWLTRDNFSHQKSLLTHSAMPILNCGAGNVDVYIEIEGVRAEEYAVPLLKSEARYEKRCCIASEAGKVRNRPCTP